LTRTAPEVDWIRILYAYPGYITDRLIEVMASNQQILPYIDIPLQHADPGVLKSMRRPANMDWVYRTVEKLRKEMPGLALRTTFIVGYPGETEKAFETLLDFIEEVQFDRVGVEVTAGVSVGVGVNVTNGVGVAIPSAEYTRLITSP